MFLRQAGMFVPCLSGYHLVAVAAMPTATTTLSITSAIVVVHATVIASAFIVKSPVPIVWHGIALTHASLVSPKTVNAGHHLAAIPQHLLGELIHLVLGNLYHIHNRKSFSCLHPTSSRLFEAWSRYSTACPPFHTPCFQVVIFSPLAPSPSRFVDLAPP